MRKTELTPLPKVTVAVNWDIDFWLFPDGWAELGFHFLVLSIKEVSSRRAV